MSKYDDFDLDIKNTEINNNIEPQRWTIMEYCQSISINCDPPSGTTPCTSGRYRVI